VILRTLARTVRDSYEFRDTDLRLLLFLLVLGFGLFDLDESQERLIFGYRDFLFVLLPKGLFTSHHCCSLI
jgi:hypothetical protein